ncbi:MAG TPA: hypothetical protein VHW23_28425 [Kofleriaceae bacterium]|jgi:hypothetical protein|nr:hypothetical protein [Kofleriaceae bacterium]
MTNGRSLSWIDRGRWDGLLARVTDEPTPTHRPPRPAPRAAPEPTPLVTRSSYRPFVASSRQLEDRLQTLIAWIEDCVPCRAAFIADDNGLPVVEHVGAEAGHVAAASSILLLLASVRALMRDSGGWLSLELGAQVLHVVEVATRWGRFAIGVVTEDTLPRDFLLALSGAVERAFHGESTPGEAT